MFNLTDINKRQNTFEYILSITISLIPISMVIGAAFMEFFIILTCLIFFYLNLNNIGINYYKNRFIKLFFAFCIFLIFGSFFSDYFLNSIRNTLFYFRFGILVLAIWYLLDNYNKFKILFFYFITITFLILIISTFLNIVFFEEYIYYNNRISGLFGEELIQGSFVLRTLPIFIIFYFYNKENINKKFIYIFYIILFSSIFLIIISGERASIFLMLIGIFLMFIILKINLKKIFIILSSILIISLSSFSIFPQIKERVIDRTYKELFFKYDLENETKTKKIQLFSQGHQDHIETGIMIFKNNIIKGVGVRNYRKECRKDIYKKVGEYYCTTHPHNTFIQILSETGLIGFIFFISFLVYVYLIVIEYLKNIYIRGVKSNVCLGISMIMILINFFPFVPTGSFFNNWLSTLYFIPIALLLHELNSHKT